LIAHTLRSLTRNMATHYVGDRYVWAMLYGIRRFAGLQVYLQSILSGTPLILLDFMQAPSVIVEALARYGCNALSATPTFWRQLAMVPGFERLALRNSDWGDLMTNLSGCGLGVIAVVGWEWRRRVLRRALLLSSFRRRQGCGF
jgi:acyl-CoA synthetase (AMP-forming)/AMP-acid ligase II